MRESIGFGGKLPFLTVLSERLTVVSLVFGLDVVLNGVFSNKISLIDPTR